MTNRKIAKGYQRNKITLILQNDELDTFESIFSEDKTELGLYIMGVIQKVKAREGAK